MIPFKAVFKPRKYTESGMFEGFDDSKAESVLIVDCIKTNGVPGMLFIRQDGSLDVDVIKCFSDCKWGQLLGDSPCLRNSGRGALSRSKQRPKH